MKALFIALTAWLCLVGSASLHHISPPILPGVPTAVHNRILQRGVVLYELCTSVEEYPNFVAQTEDVTAAAQKVIGLPARRVVAGEKADVYICFPNDAEFVRVCTAGAAGCILYWGDPQIIYMRRALLYSDWRTTISHEGINVGHAMGEHERYDDINFKCIVAPVPPTVMSCGSGIWVATAFDRDVIWQLFVPDAPSAVSLVRSQGWVTLNWNLIRKDGGATHWANPKIDNATRVSFAMSECDGCPIVWIGEVCGATYSYCFTDPKELKRGFDAYWIAPGRCYYLRMENAAFWSVPQVSAPGYWTKVGCV